MTARYLDKQGREQIGTSAVCTEISENYHVQATITIHYRADAPQSILLEKDIGIFQSITTGSVILVLVCIGLLIATFRLLRRSARRRGADSALFAAEGSADVSAFDQQTNYTMSYGDVGHSSFHSRSQGTDPAPFLGTDSAGISALEWQRYFKLMSDAAVGYSNYPTRRIGLKEALFFLYARDITPYTDDVQYRRDKLHPLLNHLVAAAIMMDLILQRRIALVQSGNILARAQFAIIDPTPTGDPDTDEVLSFIQTTSSGLRSVFNAFADRYLVARLIDQLRKGGYLRVHIPTNGPFTKKRTIPQNPLMRGLVNWLSKKGFTSGTIIASDDYSQAIPWFYAYTTQTPEEEVIISRVQAAIATNILSDDFTRALLLLVAAKYTPSWRFFGRYSYFPNFQTPIGIYRFYPKQERAAVHKTLQEFVKEAPADLLAVYKLAKKRDEQIENPSSA